MKKAAILGLVILVTMNMHLWANEEDQAIEPLTSVIFDDPNLELAVENRLGIEDPNETEMLALTELSASSLGISSLAGLETALNLQKLYLNDNQITDLEPLENLTQMIELELGNNQISDPCELANMTELKVLLLFENQLSDISALANLTKLTNLNLQENQISYLTPMAGMTKLLRCNLQKNQIANLSGLENSVDMLALFLDENDIADLSPLQNMTKLQQLQVEDNQVISVEPLQNLHSLVFLVLARNDINDISTLADSAFNKYSVVNLLFNPLEPKAYCESLPAIKVNNPGANVFPSAADSPFAILQDCMGSIEDLEVIASFWLSDCDAEDLCGGTDLDRSGRIDLDDIDLFTEFWFSGAP